ncbi:DNA-3-methyladenine glycosylase 2 family protein [Paraburkholderia megapolitana]|uniref:DNA-3-methyladenine glycosylase II n=1 Tax=Paraburkholderia megapolitana TaxID=420953 RepID=A0A1I3LEK9_9BURK|nr:AlkA N-terminal domain-containing protein [Paraburkholderia megapolitana]QDQ80685.1 helix-turn-helix domain-containing protein [Paraburkholderia megapolitana]SFI83208.1 DNA-3-methyladenine glycosylase II [Paraburkholderia megapolitana]
MTFDRDSCYEAVLARDRRFDGWFFVAVTSTGIYCRPVCPVRSPKLANCRFYANAAAAEQAGFRPCLRCRPELAPGHGLLDVSRRLAQAAAALIGAGFLNDANLSALAARVGVSTRHLRRIFEAEFGVSPIDYAQTQRLLMAKRLLADTTLPAAQVALTAGFGSVRRFNDLFSRRYGFTPARVRKHATDAARAATADTLTLDLPYRPPFAWDALLYSLTSQAISGVERVTHDSYTRAIAVPHDGTRVTGWLRADHLPQRLALRITLSSSLTPVVPSLLAQVRRFFDLDCRPDLIDARLGALAAALPGMRVPGAFDGFETAVRAIALRHWPRADAHAWLQRIADAFGTPVAQAPDGLRTAFPSAHALASVSAQTLRATGLPLRGVTCLLKLADEVVQQRVFLEPFTPLDETLAHLRDVIGLDEWSVQYVAMRALGWPNAYPLGDPLIAQMAPDDGACWAPWRAYAAQHFAYAAGQEASAA